MIIRKVGRAAASDELSSVTVGLHRSQFNEMIARMWHEEPATAIGIVC